MKKIILTLLVMSFVILKSSSQKKSLQIGLKLLNELTFYNGFVPGFGGQIIYQMGRHGGLESGIYYDNQITTFYFYTTSTSIFTEVAERHLTIPVWYHFHSKAINFSGGPAMSYFIGWKDKTKSPFISVTNYNTNTLEIIGSAGISKTIQLSKAIILEPEIRFNYILGRNDGNLALNIALRKIFF